MKNYLKLTHKISLFYYHYMYVDRQDYLADQIFVKHQLTVSFKNKEFAKGNMRLVCCKIKKKDEDRFLKAMEDLKAKAMIMGVTEYEEVCKILNWG